MQWISKDEIIAVQDVKGHDDLAVSPQLHSTIEPPVELVECECSALYSTMTIERRRKKL